MLIVIDICKKISIIYVCVYRHTHKHEHIFSLRVSEATQEAYIKCLSLRRSKNMTPTDT